MTSCVTEQLLEISTGAPKGKDSRKVLVRETVGFRMLVLSLKL